MKAFVVLVLLTAQVSAQPTFDARAMVGWCLVKWSDGRVDVDGTGDAGEIDIEYRPARWFSTGPYLGFARYEDDTVFINNREWTVREQFIDYGVRMYAHLGRCFGGLGVGIETGGVVRGNMSATSFELGCTYEKIRFSYIRTSASDAVLDQQTHRLMFGFEL